VKVFAHKHNTSAVQNLTASAILLLMMPLFDACVLLCSATNARQTWSYLKGPSPKEHKHLVSVGSPILITAEADEIVKFADWIQS
jgi:hypothetical protein